MKSENETNSLATKVLDLIEEVETNLSIVDGPRGQFVIVPAPGGSKLTKDGLNVLKAMLNKPTRDTERLLLLDYIVRYAETIHTQVGDGTTSSTRIGCAVVEDILREDDYDWDYVELRKQYRKLKSEILDKVDDFTLKVSELDQKAFLGFLYSQAYTASHGDAKVSTCVKEWFSHAPDYVGLWNNLVCIPGTPDDAEFDIHLEERGLTLYNYHPGATQMYNCGDTTDVRSPDALVIVVETVTPSNAETIRKHVEAATTPVYVVCDRAGSICGELVAAQKGGTFSPMEPMAAELSHKALLDAYHADAEDEDWVPPEVYAIPNCSIDYDGQSLRIKGLFEYDELGVVKGYAPDSAQGHFLVAVNGVRNRQSLNARQYRTLSLMVTTYVFEKPPVLILGGSEDVIERNTDIIEDTILSVTRGYEHGVVKGANRTLKDILNTMVTSSDRSSSDKLLLEYLNSAISGVCGHLHSDGEVIDVVTGKRRVFSEETLRTDDPVMITQPASAIPTIVEGIDKYLLRLSCIGAVIV